MSDAEMIKAICKRLDKVEDRQEKLQEQDHKTELVTRSLEVTVNRLEDIVTILQTKAKEKWSKVGIIVLTASITAFVTGIVSILFEKFTNIF